MTQKLLRRWTVGIIIFFVNSLGCSRSHCSGSASYTSPLEEDPHRCGSTNCSPLRINSFQGIYSMEGEICPLKEIVDIKKKYKVRYRLSRLVFTGSATSGLMRHTLLELWDRQDEVCATTLASILYAVHLLRSSSTHSSGWCWYSDGNFHKVLCVRRRICYWNEGNSLKHRFYMDLIFQGTHWHSPSIHLCHIIFILTRSWRRAASLVFDYYHNGRRWNWFGYLRLLWLHPDI